ncbi:MAG: MSHA biogenesis protein MshQ [Glaciecola sp.]|jgi:MSHA biogenesis protein MshQ
MNSQHRNSRYVIIYLLWVLSIFSSNAFSATEQVRVNSGNNDAEELVSDGDMSRSSTDLEFGYDDHAGGLQIVGMLFESINIPQGATISSAYIEFVTDETDSGTTNLVIFGEDNESPTIFTNSDDNISDRTKTSASVNWTPAAWNNVNELQQTSDISVIIQEIVNRPGWAANNDVVIIIEPGSGCTSSSCERTAESHDGDSDEAPLLVVEYSVEPQPPIAEYRFDELSWSGTSGEVTDNSSNGFNGIAIGGISTAIGKICNAANIPSNNSASTFEAVDSGVDLDSTIGSSGTISLWYRGNSAWNSGSDKRLFDASDGDKYFLADITSDGRVKFFFEDGSDGDYNKTTVGTFNVGAGVWTHLAFVWDVASNTAKIFVDGVEQSVSGTNGNTAAFDGYATLYFGDNRNTSYSTGESSADGLIDEALVFDSVVTSAQIQTIFTNQDAGNNYDGSTRTCPIPPTLSCDSGTLNAVGIRIDNGGNSSQITTTTEALAIHAEWLDAGSPASGLIDGGTYNVAASGSSTVDRIDFGGAGHDFTGTLPYPGYSAGVDGSDFLVHTSGTLSLPAGDYTIYVESDDGFSFIMNTLSGDAVSFNKFGSSNAGASNELRHETTTGNSNTGGSFTLTQDSLFDIAAIFFERGGGDYLEISIANEILTNEAPSGYEILRDGALSGAVTFGACVAPIPLLEYRFEELSWDGSSGEVIDNTGNGYNAQVISNSAPESVSPALIGNPGTCGYASQNNGSIQATGLPLDTSTDGVKTTVTFWMNWEGTGNSMPIGWNYHDIWFNNGSMGFNTFNNDIYGISSAGLENGWHHVAVEFTNGDVTSNRMHIDGVEQVLSQRFGTPNNANAYVNSQMRVGGVSNSTGFNFNGQLDEFRVYESALSTSQVASIMAETHACAIPGVHHYEIVHDGQGLTCDTETVTLRACEDASCSTLSSQPTTLDFLADGAVISSPTFAGSTTVSFNNTDVETLSFGIDNPSIPALNPAVCNDSVGNSCDMVFTNAGFRFLYGASNNTTLPNQTSGTIFAEALKIQAVEDTDGVCTGLFSGDKSVDLSQENVNPGGTSGLSFMINNNNIAKHTSASGTTLNFGANSIATLPTPIYNDAGQIRLHANYNVSGVALTGSSNSFWVSPAELIVSATSGATNLDGATATSSTTYPAGESFVLSVTALNSLDVITPNYSPGQIQLMLTRTGPTLTDSVDGNLFYGSASALASSASSVFQNVTLSSFSSGVSTYSSARYSEVGLLSLDVQDSNYGNASIVISATQINIGRFIPEHFTQAVAQNGVFQTTCGASIAFAAYSGQKDEATNSIGAISYLSNPILTITAYNKQGDITQNYHEDSQGSINDYMKLSGSDVSITVPSFDQVALGVDSSRLVLTADMDTGTLSQNDLTALPSSVALPKGVLHYQLSNNDHFFYNRSANALVSPFTSDIDFSTATVVDSDSVSVTSTVDASPTGVEIRFGRQVLENSFGPETSNFAQPMQLEHFDGTVFTVTSDNNCTAYEASKISLTNISLDPALTDVLGTTGSFDNGTTLEISFAAPGAGNQGEIGVLYTAYDWLKYDWDDNGVYDNSPTAIATFGLYRGDDRLFHWREIFE